MNNINQILRQTLNDSLPEYVRLMFAGFAGGLIGAYANDRLTRRREKESGIMDEKLKFIPQIEVLIDSTGKAPVPELVRQGIRKMLNESALRFRIHLKGRRLRRFNEAWTTLTNTTREEVKWDTNFKESDPQLLEVRKLLVSRFEAVKKVVEKS